MQLLALNMAASLPEEHHVAIQHCIQCSQAPCLLAIVQCILRVLTALKLAPASTQASQVASHLAAQPQATSCKSQHVEHEEHPSELTHQHVLRNCMQSPAFETPTLGTLRNIQMRRFGASAAMPWPHEQDPSVSGNTVK